MRKSDFISLALVIFFPSMARSAQLLSTQDDFQIFLNEAQGQSRETQLQAWGRFEAKYQEIYDLIVFNKGRPGWEQKRQEKLNQFLDSLPSLALPMMNLFANANTTIQTQEDRFVQQFSDMARDTKVYFLPSALSFNGKASEMPNVPKSSMFMGVDFIVHRGDDLGILFSHEFFHVYHYNKLTEGSAGETMATPLWTEGFATFVSGIINPEHDDGELLMDAQLGAWCANASQVAQGAVEYLSVLDTNGEDPVHGYSDWFKMSGQTQPTRRGYCLGMRITRALAQEHPLTEMVLWDESTFSRLARQELLKLTRP